MISQFIYVFKFFKYQLFSSHKKGHGIHSPFIFNLVTKVFANKDADESLKKLNKMYTKYKHSNEILEYNEIGAGSVYKSNRNETVGNIVKRSSVNKKYARLLYNLIRYYKPMDILELGTSVGISTAYIAQASPKSNLTSIEGIQAKIKIARKISTDLNQTNIKFVHGDFDTVLFSELENIKKLDFVFFDGNHRKENTLKYFDSCLKKAHNDSIFVFDDIHWPKDMEEAWNIIKTNKDVKLSIDIFRMGLIFFKKELSYEQYVIKF